MSILNVFQRERFPSIGKALRKILGKREYEVVLQECPDRRMLLQVAAERSGKSIDELLEETASMLSLRIAPRVISTEAEHLPDGITLSTMRKSGFIAVIRERVFRGVICSNPATLPVFYRSKENLEYLLAPWEKIAQALGRSEERLEQVRSEEAQARRGEEAQIVTKVLSFLVSEVENHNRSEVKISIDQKGVQYIFTTSDGRTGRGEIHENLAPAVMRFLEDGNQKIGGRDFRITCIEKRRYYSLSWDDAVRSNSGMVANSANSSDERTVLPARNGGSEYTSSVLLIDDSETFGSIVERFFAREGVTVERRLHAKQALAELCAGTLRPRVIVCDVHMPEMNGVEFVREFGKIDSLSDITLFMLTSDEEVDTELEAIRGGVEAYLRKNEDPRLLCAHVERVLKTTRNFSEAA